MSVLVYDAVPFNDRDSTRRTVVLSDGTVVVFVKTSVFDITAFTSTDRVTFTQKFTINLGAAQFAAFSVAVESGDHLQVVFQTAGTHSNIFWQRFTYAGSLTWTAGTPESVMSNANRVVGALDLDVLGTTGCVVVWRELTGTDGQKIILRARGTGGWGAEVVAVNSNFPNQNSSKETCFISRDTAGPSGNFQRMYFGAIYNTQAAANGAWHGTARWNITDGSLESGSLLQAPDTFSEHVQTNSNPGSFHRMISFAKSSGVWYGVSFSNFINNTCTVRPWIATWSGSAIVMTYPTSFSMPASAFDLIKPTAIMLNNNKIACLARGLTTGGVNCVIVDMVGLTVSTSFIFSLPLFGVPLIPYAGAQRNVTTVADVLMVLSSDGRTFVDTNDAPSIPTNIVPVNNAVVDTDLPTVQATLPTPVRSIPRKASWDIASDAAFTVNVKTVLESDNDLDEFGVHSESLQLSQELNQALPWYIRSKTIDAFGRESTYSPSTQFTVSHPPQVSNMVPDNVTSAYGVNTVFAWTFVDTSSVDFQTAFQIIVEKLADGSVITDTGKVNSVNKTYSILLPIGAKDIPLRWKIRVWDSDTIPGPYSSYKLLRVSDVPSVNITSPAHSSSINTSTPTIVWTYTSTGSFAETAYRVIVKDRTLQQNTIHDSGTLSGSALQYIIPNGLLVNGTDYTVTVTVYDTQGLSGSDSNDFSTAWSQPAQPAFTVSSASYSTAGYHVVSWDNTAQDAQFNAYNVYRRLAGDTAWSKIFETNQTQSSYAYQDWFANSDTTYEYVVVQKANRFGSPVESAYANPQTAQAASADYFLLHPTDPTRNLKLSHVTDENFTDEYEREVLLLIGRGRKVNRGTHWGYKGSLTCKVWDEADRTAREFRLMIEQLMIEQTQLYLRNPFGDTFLVDIQDMEFARMAGVGVREFGTLTVPYLELDATTSRTLAPSLDPEDYPGY